MEDLKDREKVEQKVKIEEVKPSNEDFARASTSGRMPNERGTHPWSNFFSRRRLSGEKILKQKGGKGNKQKDIQHVNNQGRSSADEPYSFESNGAWIFPDGGKRLCITTTGKQIMNITEGFFSEAKEQLGNLSSPVAGNVKQGKEDGDTSQRCEESEIDDFTDAETPRGPVGQVMKVVIMVGFATLVLFTRQTKPDK